ncbi:MAG: hypothetical protein A2W22_04655 [Candidatus Levybacteria bacterium RBG_16_35_11]|nr:MAG: hypothetical protein A2W22_04655 [Candidatus Levybacteria bacterium RBG_16_35_11]
MKIFVSSTIKDLGDLRNELYRRLKELGHTPWLSEMSDFPSNLHPDSMTNCLRVAEECDLFVVLLDKRAGLSYLKEGTAYSDLSGLKISEAEYRCARRKGKQICIFIRKRAEYESAIYRQVKDDEKQKESIKWYSENAVYEFYERLMHEEPHIPWRYTFDSINDIIEPLKSIIGEFFQIEVFKDSKIERQIEYIQENPNFLIEIPAENRDKLLISIINHCSIKIRQFATKIISQNFDIVGNDVRQEFLKLLKDNNFVKRTTQSLLDASIIYYRAKINWYFAYYFLHDFDKYPQTFQEIITPQIPNILNDWGKFLDDERVETWGEFEYNNRFGVLQDYFSAALSNFNLRIGKQ